MRRNTGLGLILGLLLTVGFGCERSEENRKGDDKPTVETASRETADQEKAAENEAGEEEAAEEKTADDAYQQLGQMYGAFGEACPGADAGDPLCRAGMAEQMQRQMMHMHSNRRGWGWMHGGKRMGRMHRGMHRGKAGAEMPMGPNWRNTAMDRWHGQMADWHERMAEQMGEAGSEDLAERHRQLMERHAAMAEAVEEPEGEGDEVSEPTTDGRRLYVASCAACHGEDGRGVSRAFPPLVDSDIVAGDDQRLIRIVTRGLAGPLEVDEETYDGVMPGFAGRLSDAQVAAVLSYIRQAWYDDDASISASQVAKIRKQAAGKGPLSTRELGVIPEDGD